jgi:hypothetical protein
VTHGSSNFSQDGLEQSNSHSNFHSMHDINKPAEKAMLQYHGEYRLPANWKLCSFGVRPVM